MGDWALPLLEFTALLLVAWCLADARRRGSRYVLELAAGALYGLAVEQLAIWGAGAAGRPDAYRYGPFAWLATPDVPVAVVVSWGALLYAAMKYTDRLGIPVWARPAADALYALMLDLTMDVVAVQLGFWRWATPPDRQWFGVPFSNFGGWLLVAALFSAGVRGLRLLVPPGRPLRYAGLLAALVAGLAALTTRGVARLFTGGERDAWPAGLLALLAVVHLAGGLLWRRHAGPAVARRGPAGGGSAALLADPAVGLPVAWHLTYLGVAALTGAFAQRPAILFLTGVLAAVGVLLTIGMLPVARE